MKKKIVLILVIVISLFLVQPVRAGWIDDMYNSLNDRIVKLEQFKNQAYLEDKGKIEYRISILENKASVPIVSNSSVNTGNLEARITALEVENKQLRNDIISKDEGTKQLLMQIVALLLAKK